MSKQNIEIVRKPLRVRDTSRRTLDQRLSLRFPRLAAANTRLTARLAPSSRLRQALVWRGARLALEAFNRRDVNAAYIPLHPEVEFYPARGWTQAGLNPCYRGLEGYREFVSAWSEVFGADLRIEPEELIDLGDRMVMLGQLPVRGQASGVPITEKLAYVFTLKDLLVIRQEEYLDHAEALKAVGLEA